LEDIMKKLLCTLLCALLLLSSCAPTYHTKIVETERYPCRELAEVQAAYQTRKGRSGSDDTKLQDLRQRISVLQSKCAAFEKTVRWYIEQYDLPEAEAEKKAASVERSIPMEYETRSTLSPWTVVAIVTGVVLVIGVGLLLWVAASLSGMGGTVTVSGF
jgi:hypothetical protein